MKRKANFEWDEQKNQENIDKHGISFYLAQYAFADPNRVILKDVSLSEEISFEYLAQVIGEKGKISMKNKINYSDEPMEDVEIIKDFLPSPEELAFKEETVKITIALSRQSIDFFKKQASRHKTQYQKLIRRLLDEYVNRQTSL